MKETTSALDFFLREMQAFPLLSREEEVELGKPIKDKLVCEAAAALALETRPLTDEENHELTRVRRASKRAEDRLCRHNLRLVVKIARKYLNRGLDLPDLIQEGNLGLMKAAEKFDYAKGFKFVTYATWWIRQSISRGIDDTASTIRRPVHMMEDVRKLHRVLSRFALLGIEATDEAVAEALGETIEKYRDIAEAAFTVSSLDAPMTDDPDSDPIGVTLAAPEEERPDVIVANHLFSEKVYKLLDGLDDRSRDVILRRHGMGGHAEQTLEQVGTVHEVTRERIRQIEAKAMRKIVKTKVRQIARLTGKMPPSPKEEVPKKPKNKSKAGGIGDATSDVTGGTVGGVNPDAAPTEEVSTQQHGS
jgi:RNA polymerase primary sigma factor